MTTLKQEMREHFEKHSSMAFYENNAAFEEGLLEKILNLSFANLPSVNRARWSILAVRTPVLLEKLRRASNEKRLTESAVVLIVCDSLKPAEMDEAGSSISHDLQLLVLSLSYAAKYYCIDFLPVASFDRYSISRELALGYDLQITAVICLGRFRDQQQPDACPPGWSYSKAVKVI